MIESDRLIAPQAGLQEEAYDRAIRPHRLEDYVGQPTVREQMEIFISAARARNEALDHTLIFGPPGLGKTTLANIIANEMGVAIKTTSGPVLEKAGDLAAMLTNLEQGDVLFIDEIHRLNAAVEAGGPLHQAGPAAVYPGGGDHPGRIADIAAAGPLWYRAAARVLQYPRPDLDCA